jgi:hypothetical protein
MHRTVAVDQKLYFLYCDAAQQKVSATGTAANNETREEPKSTELLSLSMVDNWIS